MNIKYNSLLEDFSEGERNVLIIWNKSISIFQRGHFVSNLMPNLTVFCDDEFFYNFIITNNIMNN